MMEAHGSVQLWLERGWLWEVLQAVSSDIGCCTPLVEHEGLHASLLRCIPFMLAYDTFNDTSACR